MTARRIEQQEEPETSYEQYGEDIIEWDMDEKLIDTLKSMSVNPSDYKREAMWLAGLAEVDENEKELFRSADKLSKIEGLDPDRRDVLRLRLAEYLRESVKEIRRQMKPQEVQRKVAAKHAAPQHEQGGRFEPPHIAPGTTQLPTPLTQPQTLQLQPESPLQRITLGTIQPSVSQKAALPIQPQTTKPVAAQPQVIKGSVPIGALLRGEIGRKTLYLIPTESALPSAIIASQLKIEGRRVVNVEEIVYGEKRRETIPFDGIYVLTRPGYRKDYTQNRLLPSPNQANILKLKRILRDLINIAHVEISLITTKEMYEKDEELKSLLEMLGINKIMEVTLNEEDVRRMLEGLKIRHEGFEIQVDANLLKRAVALMPGLAERLKEEGFEGVKKFVAQLNMRKEDKEEVLRTFYNALFNQYHEYPNIRLAESLLGVIHNKRQSSRDSSRRFGGGVKLPVDWWLSYFIYLHVILPFLLSSLYDL
jgi:hypothetical protein